MMTEEQSRPGPHQGQPILVAGEQLEGDPLEQTHVAMILLHERGATAAGMLELAAQWNQPDFTYLVPQAAGNSWHPFSFLAPLASRAARAGQGLRLCLWGAPHPIPRPRRHDISPSTTPVKA